MLQPRALTEWFVRNMRFYADALIDYLSAKLRPWNGLIIGFVTGAGGVLALAFAVGLILGVSRISAFMPFIVAYCASHGGYKVWGKSATELKYRRRLQCGITGIATGLVAYITQYQIDQHFFGMFTPFLMLVLFLAIGLFMGLVGGWLKEASQKP